MSVPRRDPVMSVGERIATWREYRQLSQVACAQLAGKPLPWWRNIERGVAHVSRLSDLIVIARVLGVGDLTDLTGCQELGMALDRADDPSLPRVRSALLFAHYQHGGGEEPAGLRADLDAGWEIFHNGSRFRAALGAELPRLLADAVRGGCAGTLTETYILAAHWLHSAGALDLMWLASERALAAARDGEDRALATQASWQACWTLNAMGRSEEAFEFGARGAALAEPHLADGSDDELASWGILQLQCAIAAARCSRAADAWQRWGAAQQVTNRLPGGYVHRWHSFGTANVAAYAVAVPVELGAVGEAVRAAERFDPLTLPTRQRRARTLVDVARGYVGRHDDVAALHVLERAAAESIDMVRGSVLVHEIVREVLRRQRGTLGREIREYARRIGVLME